MSNIDPVGRIPEWTLGWRLKRSLAEAGMTAEEMAVEVGYVPKSISRWVNDKGRPRPVVLKRWAMATGVPYAWLIGQDGGPDVGVSGSAWTQSPYGSHPATADAFLTSAAA